MLLLDLIMSVYALQYHDIQSVLNYILSVPINKSKAIILMTLWCSAARVNRYVFLCASNATVVDH